jgi:hypothetical protein
LLFKFAHVLVVPIQRGLKKKKTAANFFAAGANQLSSPKNLPTIAMGITTPRMPATVIVIHIHERLRRDEDRARIDGHRRGYMNRRRAPGIRDGVKRGLGI